MTKTADVANSWNSEAASPNALPERMQQHQRALSETTCTYACMCTHIPYMCVYIYIYDYTYMFYSNTCARKCERHCFSEVLRLLGCMVCLCRCVPYDCCLHGCMRKFAGIHVCEHLPAHVHVHVHLCAYVYWSVSLNACECMCI